MINNAIVATFGASSPNQQSGFGYSISIDISDNSYYCENEEL